MSDKVVCVELEALQPGDYVVRIEESSGFRLKQSGYIQSEQSLERLREAGVKSVWVDPSRRKASPPDEAPEPQGKAETTKPRRLYLEARSAMARFYEAVAGDAMPDIEEASQYAKGFVDGALKHPTTMSCLTRIREKDAYLMEHSLNVCILMALFARHLGLDRELIDKLALGALLHDLGKVKVPESILMKPGKLTDEEFEVMKTHVTHSAAILAEEPGLPPEVMDVVANHHERLDGHGYPAGKGAESLSQYARMITIVDVYDALTAERCYKSAMPPTRALKILLDLSGSHFDRTLVQQFIKCIGIYPAGTLVRLKSQRLAVVMEVPPETPLKPLVKLIYNAKSRTHLPVQQLDLRTSQDSIECAEDPALYGLNIARYLDA
ncbi:HD-GYP domain-containing protein [Gallaecimonas kandeliae]|uniref:HD-GYP domain-containing protein n=1 Tax=Gallaecimonas kandeliae TaxID=3029055 RepID=UPI002648E01D|nr:HD-GYP domain-containing protein [Gallaecimonas kandeliae]WKE64825.1 HD-GYP domain-containing protein [Gallaecimonas kandeliae]